MTKSKKFKKSKKHFITPLSPLRSKEKNITLVKEEKETKSKNF